jgi:hypothetical protein
MKPKPPTRGVVVHLPYGFFDDGSPYVDFSIATWGGIGEDDVTWVSPSLSQASYGKSAGVVERDGNDVLLRSS